MSEVLHDEDSGKVGAMAKRIANLFRKTPHWTESALQERSTISLPGVQIPLIFESVTLPQGKTVSDYVRDTASREGAYYHDSHWTPGAPNLRFTDNEREAFIEGLRPVAEELYAED